MVNRKKSKLTSLPTNAPSTKGIQLSLIGKFFTGFLGVVAVVYAILPYHFPLSSKDKDINDFYGIWYAEYSYPSAQGIQAIKGTTEYFKNGSYSFMGEIEAVENLHSYRIRYQIDATGEWEVESNSLIIKQKDYKTFVMDAQDIKTGLPIKIHNQPINKQLLKLDNRIPSELSEQFDILKTEKGKIVIKGIDPLGNQLVVKLIRQSKRFQR